LSKSNKKEYLHNTSISLKIHFNTQTIGFVQQTNKKQPKYF